MVEFRYGFGRGGLSEQEVGRLLLREGAQEEGDGRGDEQDRCRSQQGPQRDAPHALTPTPSKRWVCRQGVKSVTRSFIACARFQLAIHARGEAPSTDRK